MWNASVAKLLGETLAVFPKNGHLEPKIHQKLESVFSGRGAGVEWFDIHVSQAVGVVSRLIQELETEGAEAAKNDWDGSRVGEA